LTLNLVQTAREQSLQIGQNDLVGILNSASLSWQHGPGLDIPVDFQGLGIVLAGQGQLKVRPRFFCGLLVTGNQEQNHR